MYLHIKRILPTVHKTTNFLGFSTKTGINTKANTKHTAAPNTHAPNTNSLSHLLSANHAAFSCCEVGAGSCAGRSCDEVGSRIAPYLGAKGLMRWRKVGSEVEVSGSARRQPMLLREARQADSLEADMVVGR